MPNIKKGRKKNYQIKNSGKIFLTEEQLKVTSKTLSAQQEGKGSNRQGCPYRQLTTGKLIYIYIISKSQIS